MGIHSYNKPKYLGHYLIIILVAILAFFQISLLINPLKWDLIDQAYPWKYFIGECLQNGYLPLWNPFQLLGYPIHADPQSSAWYPIVWFFGYFFAYDIYSVSLDFILHIIIAGIGMHYLIRALNIDDKIALMAAIAYMLSGFFVGNAQHFMWIISASWIPFVIGIYIKFSRKPEIKHILILSTVMFMFISGGYPAFILTTAYLLFAIFIFYSTRKFIKKDFKELKKYILLNVVGLVLILIVSSVVIAGLSSLSDQMTRGSGVTLVQALFCPFSVNSFVSFVFPFAVVSEISYFNTDLSMANGYFGIIFLVIFVFSAFIKHKKIIWLFLIWGLLMLGLAVGDAIPFREFAYNYIPFMNLFRFPSLFRIFLILCFIVVASAGINNIVNHKKLFVSFRIYFLIVTLILISLAIYFNLNAPNSFSSVLNNDIFQFNQESMISQHLAFQSIISVVLISGLLAILYFIKSPKKLLSLIVLVIAIDMIIAAQLNGPVTVYSNQFKSSHVKEFSYNFPPGFPAPDNKRPVRANNDQSGIGYGPLWRNLNIFQKKIAYDGYNPLHLKGFECLHDSLPDLFSSIISKPAIFFNDSLQHKDDTIIITSFSPNCIELQIITKNKASITYQQNFYPGWKAYINDEESEISISNFAFISTILPEGENNVKIIYEPEYVIIGFYISLITFILLCLGSIFLELYDRKNIRRIIR